MGLVNLGLARYSPHFSNPNGIGNNRSTFQGKSPNLELVTFELQCSKPLGPTCDMGLQSVETGIKASHFLLSKPKWNCKNMSKDGKDSSSNLENFLPHSYFPFVKPSHFSSLIPPDNVTQNILQVLFNPYPRSHLQTYFCEVLPLL